MRRFAMALALATALAASVAEASSVTVKVSATIREVQCTSEQLTRIRACAHGAQSLAVAPFKSLAAGTGRGTERIEIDYDRHVLVRTILF